MTASNANRAARGNPYPALPPASEPSARERPILFSAPMVRALLAGTKTQTRRIVKPAAPAEAVDAGVITSGTESNGLWWWLDSKELEWASPVGDEFRCPYGVPGDVLWVRENCRAEELASGTDGLRYPADDTWQPIQNTAEAAERWVVLNHYDQKRRPRGSIVPAIHMPRWASRISLRITDVRVERLQDISEADAIAEGIEYRAVDRGYPGAPLQDAYFCGGGHEEGYQSAVAAYRALWEHINGPGSWDANPWVWAVSFERIMHPSAQDASDGKEIPGGPPT